MTEASRVLPQVRHIGWDVVIGKDGEVIIWDGNTRPDPILIQLPSKQGVWSNYKKFVKKNLFVVES